MPQSKPQEVSPHPSQPLAGAGELFHPACDTHTDKGICCSEPAPSASLMLAAVQTRARKAGRVSSGRRLSGMVLLAHSRASEAAALWTPAGSKGWRGCGKRRGRKQMEQRPARGAVTAPSFPGSEGRRLGGPENFGALGGRPAAALRLAPRPPLGPLTPQSVEARRCRSYFSDLVLLRGVPARGGRRGFDGDLAAVDGGSAGAGGSRLSLLAALPLSLCSKGNAAPWSPLFVSRARACEREGEGRARASPARVYSQRRRAPAQPCSRRRRERSEAVRGAACAVMQPHGGKKKGRGGKSARESWREPS